MLTPPEGFTPTLDQLSSIDKIMLDAISSAAFHEICLLPYGVRQPFFDYIQSESWSNEQIEIIAVYVLNYPTYEMQGVRDIFINYEQNEVAYMLKAILERLKENENR